MSSQTHSQDYSEALPALNISVGKMGMWVFLVSEIMFFTGLIGSYIVLRLGSQGWPEPSSMLNTRLLGFNTFVLLSSSLTMVLAHHAIVEGRRGDCVRNLLLTALLGGAFLAIKGFDYVHMWHEGFTLSTSLFGSCYYLLTGFHALHVLSGIILLLVLAKSVSGPLWQELAVRVESSGLYWHFIDMVWVVLFTILCLI